MNRKTIRIAVAAAVVATALLGLHYLGGSPVGTTVAWADVLQNIDAAQTVVFTLETETISEGKEHFWRKGTIRIKEPHRRTEAEGRHWWEGAPVDKETTVGIMDVSRQNRFVLFHPEHKWAFYAPDHGWHDTLETYDGLKRDFRDGTERYVGEQEIDGRKVVCFKVVKENKVLTVWADPHTTLPVRVERTAEDGSERTVLSDIAFDVEVPDELFDMTLPSDYVVVNLATEEFTIPFELTEEFLVEGLRQRAVSLGGTFPILFFMGGRPGSHEESLIQQRTAAPTETFGIANLAAEYMKRLPNGSCCQYVGEGVRLGDADSVVFWYQTPGSATCRAVYGDLTVKDVAPEDLPPVSWPPARMKFTE